MEADSSDTCGQWVGQCWAGLGVFGQCWAGLGVLVSVGRG